MQTKLLVPVLAAGLALSASVFGQNANADVGWTRSTAADSITGANAYNPNTYGAKMHQPARAAGTNLQWFEDVVKPRMAAANWRAEEGD
jgi:hypothetical protein